MLFSQYEADLEIARYCIQNNCYGVLSKDSDFLILGTIYIPFENIFIQSDRKLFVDQFDLLTTSKVLSLKPEYLPMFACLVGNDYTSPFESILNELHSQIGIESKLPQDIIQGVAGFLASQPDHYSFLTKLLKNKKSEKRGNFPFLIFVGLFLQ